MTKKKENSVDHSQRLADNNALSGNSGLQEFVLPQLSLPTGGGAVRGIEEKFQVNAVSGTSLFSIPLPFSPSRDGTPAVGLHYNSGAGNSAFGLGWQLSISSIVRKTEKRLPEYRDDDESDTFTLAGGEDLVPLLELSGDQWIPYAAERNIDGITYSIKRYRSRIEGAFSRIEKWTNKRTNEVHWKTISASNFHSYYGLTAESRLADPADPSRVFEWMLCRTHDDKGNISLYEYKHEDFSAILPEVFEKNRINKCVQLYLKRILYGIKKPYYPGDVIPTEDDFMFHLVFDYGEHDHSDVISRNIVDPSFAKWPGRKDAFSSYRAGFEIRTYRRCKRVLCFHCFDELPISPYLTRSLELIYDDELDFTGSGRKEQGFSFLRQARHSGYSWHAELNAYSSRSMPEMDFFYQPHEWNTAVRTVPRNIISNAPVGNRDRRYLWIDLYNEGIAGILAGQQGALFYQSNLGNGQFSSARPLAAAPSSSGGLKDGIVTIQELSGDGTKYLVNTLDKPEGFFRLDDTDDWLPFENFQAVPNLNTRLLRTRVMDLTGNGMGDIVQADDASLIWYESLGEEGFSLSQKVYHAVDEEDGPAIIFNDTSQCIFLADMDGDGLTDIVRIRNGEVCYWANLGYGRFSSKVTMSGAPTFDHPDHFNPSCLRLADIDGSGLTDIVYLGNNDLRIWFNQNGNRWSEEPHSIEAFPGVDQLSDIAVIDLLGNGTACIVYSTASGETPVSFIDLMDSRKPFLMTGYKNNCGKEVSITYRSSTQFYLEDKKAGRPWITKLPFPVHCIHTIRSEDKIRKTVFVSSYRYSHGFFDHAEREFRGFGRVEQLDTEDFAQFKLNDARNVVEEALHQPPVRTVSWFHTGAWFRDNDILRQYRQEYFNNEQFSEYDLPPILFPSNLSAAEAFEACRACKGLTLRVEIYANDGMPQSIYPFTASASTVEVRMIQPRTENKPASFIVVPAESVSYTFEREPADPRVLHSFVLEVNELGMAVKNASVVYGRTARPAGEMAIPDKVWEQQLRSYVTYGETIYTNDISNDDNYRLRTSCGSKLYEVNNAGILGGIFLSRDDLMRDIAAAEELPFEEDFSTGLQKRIVVHSRTYFLNDALSGPLPFAQLSGLGIVYKSCQLAYTDGLVQKYYNDDRIRVTNSMLENAKYVHLENDQNWWTQPGEQIFPVSAREQFYHSNGNRDVFGNESILEYDPYFLFTVKTTDALGNVSTVSIDYRILLPVLATDPNLNRLAIACDELGMIVASAVMGKVGQEEGDTLADPTVRMEYDFFNWKIRHAPNYIRSLTREEHRKTDTKWQERYIYSDGSGGVLMSKSRVNPGMARTWDIASASVREVYTDTRWVGNGRVIQNNKGNAVKEYEPYFSVTGNYESEDALVETGVTAISYYDALGRNVRTDYPNGTFTKNEFNSWFLKTFDPNDTVRDSRWYQNRNSPDPEAGEPADPETRAAWAAAKHHDTPGIAHFDSLGRESYTEEDHGGGKITAVYSEKDMNGRQFRLYDQLDRNISEGISNLTGGVIYANTAERGIRRAFSDVMGRLVRLWENNDREFFETYDKLHRAVSFFINQNGTETLFKHIVYGESLPDEAAKSGNYRMRAYQLFDQAGVTTTAGIDFKGNSTRVDRRLMKQYKAAVDLSVLNGLDIDGIRNASEGFLEQEVFTSSTTFDALNRPVLLSLADSSIVQTRFNAAGWLESLGVKIRGNGGFINFLQSQDYDARGQRLFSKLGNNTITKYYYDPYTFRLVNLVSKIAEADADHQAIQNISYTFDPVGNITGVRDNAQQTRFFNNAVVFPENKFEYNAIYQLLKATGREHAGLGGNSSYREMDLPVIRQLPHENDLSAVRNYREQYEYDDCGNIVRLIHSAAGAGWTRRYKYNYEDDPAERGNRLKAINMPGDPEAGFSGLYVHDAGGNITSMPHLNRLAWDFLDRLHETDPGDGNVVYYTYSSDGKRSRKIIERDGMLKERIYLGAVEIYRERPVDGTPYLERSTLNVSDNIGRIASVDVKTIDINNSDPANDRDAVLICYQYSNHLGSVCLETDEYGRLISYEEYHPFGTSSYRLCVPGYDLSLKRYRFSGKERDDETGFYYFGNRYYANWLCRWISPDAAGLAGGSNLYRYCRNNPVIYVDPDGNEEVDAKVNDVVQYKKKIKNRRAKGKNVQKDHVIAQEKIKIMRTAPDGTVHYNPGADPTVVAETGKATPTEDAKPHTKKTFHDPQADVKEINRLKNGGYKHFTTDIVEPSMGAAKRSGFSPTATDEAVWGQLDNLHSSQTLGETAAEVSGFSGETTLDVDNIDLGEVDTPATEKPGAEPAGPAEAKPKATAPEPAPVATPAKPAVEEAPKPAEKPKPKPKPKPKAKAKPTVKPTVRPTIATAGAVVSVVATGPAIKQFVEQVSSGDISGAAVTAGTTAAGFTPLWPVVMGWAVIDKYHSDPTISARAMDVGGVVEDATDSRILGATAAAGTAVGVAVYETGADMVGGLMDFGSWLGGSIYDLTHDE